MDVLTVSVKTAQTFGATTIHEKGYLYHTKPAGLLKKKTISILLLNVKSHLEIGRVNAP